jgi:plastocyanin
MTKFTFRLFCFTALIVAALIHVSFGAAAQENDNGQSVNQISDPTAARVLDMFRFEPDLVRIPVGGRVTFNNSRGQHTVKSAKGMLPAGVEKISIANTSSETRTLEVPGLYILTCKVHGRYGMVMLIAVGKPETWINPASTWTKTLSGRAGEKLAQLLERLEAKTAE